MAEMSGLWDVIPLESGVASLGKMMGKFYARPVNRQNSPSLEIVRA